MKLDKLLIVVLLTQLTTSCGIFENNEGEVTPKRNTWDPNAVKLSCGFAADEDCNGSVGVLINRNRYIFMDSKSRCTAWLIADDVIATNMHCIDHKYSGQYKVPMEDLFFKTVDNKVHSGLIKVTEFIKGKIEDSMAVDYAILRLEHPLYDIPKVKIEQTRLSDGAKVKAIVVNKRLFGDSEIDLQLDSYKNCEVSESLLRTKFEYSGINTTGDRFYALENCPVLGGNSGSALFDSLGRARGIITWSFGAEDGDTMVNSDKTGGAQSLHCLDFNLDTTDLFKYSECGY